MVSWERAECVMDLSVGTFEQERPVGQPEAGVASVAWVERSDTRGGEKSWNPGTKIMGIAMLNPSCGLVGRVHIPFVS